MSSIKSNFVISNIEELFCAIDTNFDDFENVFDQVVGQIIKNQQYLNGFVTYINIQLSNSSTRGKGLILLNSLIKLCHTDVLAEHAIAWINNALKPCQNEKQINSTAFEIIRSLLDFCSQTPDLNKAVISNILEKTVDTVKSISNESQLASVALDCLLTCLRTYPGSCGPRKIPLSKYLVSYLHLPSDHYNVRKAGKCLASLQQVGGGGVEGINHYNNWKKQQHCLISTIHGLFDQFFEYVTEFGDYTQDILNITPLEIIDQTESKNYQKIAQKIINSVVFLEEMLLGAFPVKKAILPGIILNIITRGLAITSSNLGTHVLEDSINLSTNLCQVHKNLLQLLQCLILSLGTTLLPRGQTISKLIVNYVKNVNSEEMFVIKTFCNLKLAAYETLGLWLSVAKSNSSLTSYLDGLLPILISDITPPKSELNLTVQNGSVKNMTKKAKKKFMEQNSNNFANRNQLPLGKFSLTSSNYQKEICTSSLRTIQLILNFESSFMKVIHHKQLQDFVIRTLYNVQRGDVSYPYTNNNCQIELYKTLIKLNTNHLYKIAPPLNYTIFLLTNGQNNRNQKISEICSNGISNLNSLVHPYCASLQLPIDLEDLKNHLKDDKKVKNFSELDEINFETDENEVTEDDLKIQDNNKIQSDNPFKNDNMPLPDDILSQNAINNKDIDDFSSKSRNSPSCDDEGAAILDSQNGGDSGNFLREVISSNNVVENSDDKVDKNEENIVEIDESSNDVEIVEEIETKRCKFDEEEQMETLKIDDENDVEIAEDVDEICSTFVDIVNE